MSMTLPILDHVFVAVDGGGRWCACGAAFTREHLFETALLMLGGSLALPRSDRRREARARAAQTETPLQRCRRVLAPLQAQWDALAAEVDALGLTGADRIDWWVVNNPRTREETS